MSDLDGLNFVRRGRTLLPADFHADEWLSAEVKEGREIILRASKPRSPIHHRWFFALLRKVREATGRWPDEESLLETLKVAVGHVRPLERLNGEIVMVPKSISFASMDQTRFKAFVERCLFVLAEHLSLDAEALMRETDASQGDYWQKTYGGYRQ